MTHTGAAPNEIDKNEESRAMPQGVVHTTMGAMLHQQAQTHGDKTFLTFLGRAYSYAEADALTNTIANGFAARGIGKGDHVGLLLGNCAEFVWSIFALAKLGAVSVPFNTAAKGELLGYFLNHSKVSALVVEEGLIDRCEEFAKASDRLGTIIVVPDPLGEASVATTLTTIPFAELTEAGTARPEVAVRYDDPAFLMYTSGTTGPSKGAVAPHSQALSVGAQLVSVYGYTRDDVLYTCLPLFHGNALWYSLMAAFNCGATLALARRFSASRFWQDVVDCGATQANALGAMANIVMKELDRLDRSRLKLRQCMVVPALDENTGKVFRDMGIELTSLFAQTETFAVTLFGPGEPVEKRGSAGRAHSYTEIAILDDEGWTMAPGEVGEIAVRPSVPGIMMQRYFEMPLETLGTMDGLWFHTGDRGYLDSDGYLYFVDRKKDAIRRRGENISAYELEMIISRYPGLREAAAVAVQSELGEDEVLVYCVTDPGIALDFAEIIAFCDKNMPYFMVPRYLHALEELPKTASEKIEKYKLRQWASENMHVLWDREALGIKLTR